MPTITPKRFVCCSSRSVRTYGTAADDVPGSGQKLHYQRSRVCFRMRFYLSDNLARQSKERRFR